MQGLEFLADEKPTKRGLGRASAKSGKMNTKVSTYRSCGYHAGGTIVALAACNSNATVCMPSRSTFDMMSSLCQVSSVKLAQKSRHLIFQDVPAVASNAGLQRSQHCRATCLMTSRNSSLHAPSRALSFMCHSSRPQHSETACGQSDSALKGGAWRAVDPSVLLVWSCNVQTGVEPRGHLLSCHCKLRFPSTLCGVSVQCLH